MLFTFDEIERTLSTAHDRARGFTNDVPALDVFRGAVKDLLANSDSQYPNPSHRQPPGGGDAGAATPSDAGLATSVSADFHGAESPLI